ncbi:unnamed protein product [Mytilus coruscus]|uniref:Reverse transcriptase domain-containing protein n=1 Tax=Mytilus coruscus TaxID=42192 RepID=A0A6J8BL25_MYTCO|nr:unnamed protein product [Mytilus coruscus]
MDNPSNEMFHRLIRRNRGNRNKDSMCIMENGELQYSPVDQTQSFSKYFEDLALPKDKGYDPEFLDLYCFNTIMKDKLIPHIFKSGIVIPVLKKGKNPMMMDNYRGIAVTPVVSKLFECTILPSLTQNFKQSTLQFGFTKGMSMLMAGLIISEARAEVKHRTIEPLYLITVDSQKAFDVVDHIIMLDELHEHTQNHSMWTIVKNLYSGLVSKVKWKGNIGNSFEIHQGVRQEDTTHLGLIRAEIKENDVNIKARISIARRTLYSLMNTGLHGTNGLNPQTSYKIYQSYVIPRLLYGMEILPLNQKQMDIFSRFHKKNLRNFQSMPARTATGAVYLILGALTIEAEIHKRQLSFLYNIVSCDNSTILDLVDRQLIMNMDNQQSFFCKVAGMLAMYDLPSIDSLKQQPIQT